MNINVNGENRPMTDDELAALEAARQEIQADIDSGAIVQPQE
jgi:hypothetical protein